MGQIDWRGVFPALTTKFAADGSPDWGAMASHLAFQLDAGVQGIVILGSLGESATLSREEKREAVKRFCETDRRGKPLVVTIAECSTRGACAFAEVCESEGADAIMLPPPMRYPSDWRETRRYLNEVASATGLPIMLYNNPVAYGTDIDPAQFAELADNPRFEAIKESSADTRRVADIRRLTGDRYAVLCGVDNIALECFVLGACGWVAGLVVAFPSETVRLYELASAGEWDEARRLYEWFLPLLHLDTGPKFVQQIKLVEALMGVGSARVRPPRLQLSEAEAASVEEVLNQALKNRPAIERSAYVA